MTRKPFKTASGNPVSKFRRLKDQNKVLRGLIGELWDALYEAEVMLRGARALAPKTEILEAVIVQSQEALAKAKKAGGK